MPQFPRRNTQPMRADSTRYCEFLNADSARRESIADKIAAAVCVMAVALLIGAVLYLDEGTARAECESLTKGK